MTPRSSVVSRHTTIHEYMDDTSTSVCIRGFVRHATLDGEWAILMDSEDSLPVSTASLLMMSIRHDTSSSVVEVWRKASSKSCAADFLQQIQIFAYLPTHFN